MPFVKTEIEGLVVFEPRVFEDSRGYFFEAYNEQIFAAECLGEPIVQPTSSGGRIVSAVIDKNPSYHRRTEASNLRSRRRDQTSMT